MSKGRFISSKWGISDKNSILGSLPADILSCDILEFSRSKNYLVINDHSSDYMYRSKKLFSRDTSEMIKQLTIFFNLYGQPRQIYLDSALYFDSDQMTKFLEERGIKYNITSAKNHLSNSRAEVTVKRIRHIMNFTGMNDTLFYEALALENSLIKDNSLSSASAKFMGRHVTMTATPSPVLKKNLHRSILLRQLKILIRRNLHNKKARNPHKKDVEFNLNDKVMVQCDKSLKWDVRGVIVSKNESGQSFGVLKEDTDWVIIRNKKFLKKII